MCHSLGSRALRALINPGAGYRPGTYMNSILKTGFAALSAFALMGATVVHAQDAAASSSSDSSGSVSTEDVANIAIVCVATYDYVLAKGQGAGKEAAIKEARDLARSIYKEATAGDDATVDADIAKIDKALADDVAAGGTDINDFHSTCDSLLMEDEAKPS